MSRWKRGLLVAACVVGAGAGCGGDDPAGAAEDFMAAVQADDTEAACALVDEEYILENSDSFADEMYAIFGNVSSGEDCETYIDGIPVTKRLYEGATAEVDGGFEGFTYVTISWSDNRRGIQMREVDGEWLIAGPRGL
jgi:hypothetical protein